VAGPARNRTGRGLALTRAGIVALIERPQPPWLATAGDLTQQPSDRLPCPRPSSTTFRHSQAGAHNWSTANVTCLRLRGYLGSKTAITMLDAIENKLVTVLEQLNEDFGR
jgi:hypothetical protein